MGDFNIQRCQGEEGPAKETEEGTEAGGKLKKHGVLEAT